MKDKLDNLALHRIMFSRQVSDEKRSLSPYLSDRKHVATSEVKFNFSFFIFIFYGPIRNVTSNNVVLTEV